MSPFDELAELRSVLTVQEIAEMTGLRRETLSRARPDSRFQRRTQKALDDLYSVVTRLRSSVDGDPVHLVAILRRPQAALDRRSIADLLREGKVDEALDHLPGPRAREKERGPVPISEEEKERVSALLAADPELAARLPAVEDAIRTHFGADADVQRRVAGSHGAAEEDHLYLRIESDLSFDAKVDRLAELLSDQREQLAQVRERVTIGWL